MKLKKPRVGSIYRQIAGALFIFVTGTVMLYLFFNTWFLERYYLSEKEETMMEVYASINQMSSSGELYKKRYEVSLEKLCDKNNISFLIITSDGTVKLTSAGIYDTMLTQLLDAMFFRDEMDQTQRVISNQDNYVIELQHSRKINEDYLVLWGTLNDGNMIMMRTPLESLKESAMMANRFLLSVGTFAILAGLLVASFITKKITNPLIELTSISKRMTELDFDAKYKTRKHQNEVDVLGEHMNELSETLEQTIQKLQQTNDNLQEEIKNKERDEQLRIEFISNLSHELKTPIALIQGYGEGLAEDIFTDEESRKFYCEVIVDEAKKMNRIVKQLLALNEIETGHQRITMERFDIKEMIEGALLANSLLYQQKDIKVTCDLEESLFVFADPFYSEQVLSNYLSNAFHYVDEKKEIKILVETYETVVRVNVCNTGKQIPQEDLDYIWDKFYKVDKARSREYGGSGIGLSVVKAIMDSFSMKYGVKNLEDGVCFWFELALVEGE